MLVHFPEIVRTGIATGKCDVCGKRFRYQRRFWQTRNPFNVNEHGAPKTSGEIYEELVAEARQWSEGIKRHTKCEGSGGATSLAGRPE